MIKGLHHNAYRCRDSEETRAFYEDFLGLRMVSAFEITKVARSIPSSRWMTAPASPSSRCPAHPSISNARTRWICTSRSGSSPRPSTPCWRRPRPTVERCAARSTTALSGRSISAIPTVCHRIDRQHGQTRRDHGCGDLQAARGAGALAGDEEPLIAPRRIAVIGVRTRSGQR